ncbi:MAG: cytochrome c3 family protein [Myxococcales bacterium]|nr:cytochrome c3 family protein [Myxococcales bacterium]
MMSLCLLLAISGCSRATDPPTTTRLALSPSPWKKVKFPHKAHTEDYDVACKTCHHEINAKVIKTPHPAYFRDSSFRCETCHSTAKLPRKPQACVTCHHRAPSSTTDETLSAKVVIHKSCWRKGCHAAGEGKVAANKCKSCHPGSRF